MTLTFWVTASAGASRSECWECIVVNDNFSSAATALPAIVSGSVISARTSTTATTSLEVFITASCGESEKFGAFVARDSMHITSLDLVLNGEDALFFSGVSRSDVLVRDLFVLATRIRSQQTLRLGLLVSQEVVKGVAFLFFRLDSDWLAHFSGLGLFLNLGFGVFGVVTRLSLALAPSLLLVVASALARVARLAVEGVRLLARLSLVTLSIAASFSAFNHSLTVLGFRVGIAGSSFATISSAATLAVATFLGRGAVVVVARSAVASLRGRASLSLTLTLTSAVLARLLSTPVINALKFFLVFNFLRCCLRLDNHFLCGCLLDSLLLGGGRNGVLVSGCKRSESIHEFFCAKQNGTAKVRHMLFKGRVNGANFGAFPEFLGPTKNTPLLKVKRISLSL